MDATITKKQIVIVNTVDKNSYGDIEFTYTGEDGVPQTKKIGNKRVKHFEGILIPQRYVELSFSEAYNKEYVYSAVLVKDLMEEKGLVKPEAPKPIPPPNIPSVPTPNPVSPAVQEPRKPLETPNLPSGQEVGLTTKEIGDMIRANKLTSLFGETVAMKLMEWYVNKIRKTTNC